MTGGSVEPLFWLFVSLLYLLENWTENFSFSVSYFTLFQQLGNLYNVRVFCESYETLHPQNKKNGPVKFSKTGNMGQQKRACGLLCKDLRRARLPGT